MRYIRYTSSFAAGAAGLFAGLVYHNVSSNSWFLMSAAKLVPLEIDAIVSRDIEEHIYKLTPMMKFGFPSYDALRIKQGFILSYDRRHRNPNWVMEHLTSDMVNEEACGSRRESKFFEDETIHSYFRATLDDYRNSGYDRGHLAAAANHKCCQPALDDTFILSNITPQNEYFNRGTWHSLERHVRNLAKKYGSVYVCSGPLYLPREIHAEKEDEIIKLIEGRPNKRKRRNQVKTGPQQRAKKYVIYEVVGENNVAVPTHFFKIIVIETKNDKYDMEGYIIPNQRLDAKEPLSSYMVPRDAIERAAGFLLFRQLPSSSFRYINGEESTTDLEL